MKNMILALIMVLGFSAPALATTKTEVIANISRNVILKTYEGMATDAAVLKSAVDAFAVNPTEQNLLAAQEAWRQARYAYEVSEAFLFGPMDSLGIDPMIDTWPLALTELRVILASNHELTLDFVRSLGSNVQGFHAIEFLLFGEGIVTNTKDLQLFNAREIQYLTATSALLVEQINVLMYAWNTHHDPTDLTTPAYIDVISKPGPDNDLYSSEEAVVQEFTNGIVGIINEASKAKLPDATGSDIADANARLEESPFSWNSINDYTSNVDSIYNIYAGSFQGKKGAGLKDLVANTNLDLANDIETQILNCRALIQAIPGPNNISFGRAIMTQDGRQRIFAAIAGLKKLQDDFEAKVLPLLE